MKRLWFLVWQGIRYRRGVSLLLVTAIALASFFLTLIGFVGMSAISMQREQARNRYGTQAIVADKTPELSEALAGQNILSDAGSITITAEVPHKRGSLPVLAGTMDDKAISSARIRMSDGRLPEQPGEIAVENAAISRLKPEHAPVIGKRMTMPITGADGQTTEMEFTLVGLVEDYTFYWYDMYNSGSYQDTGGRMPPSVFLYQGDAEMMEAIREYALLDTASMAYRDILSDLSYSLNSNVHNNLVPVYGSAIPEGTLNVLAVAALCAGLLLVSVICIVLNAFMLSIDKRRRQLALLRTIGATRRQARRIVMMEALALYGIGMPAGLLAGWGLSAAAVSLFALLTGMELLYQFHLLIPAATALITLVAVLLSVIVPALRAGYSAPIVIVKLPRRQHASRIRGSGRLSPMLLTLHSMRRGKLRTVLTVFSLVLAVFLLNLGMFSINDIFYINNDALTYDYSVYRGNGLQLSSYAGITQAAPVQSDEHDLLTLAQELRDSIDVRMISRKYASVINIRIPEDKADDYVRSYSEFGSFGSREAEDIRKQLKERGFSETDRVIGGRVITADDALLDHLQSYIDEGKIDREAIKEGREIILYLPSYVSFRFEYENGSEAGWYIADKDTVRYIGDSRLKNLPIRTNTSYHAGDVLELSTFTGDIRSEDTGPFELQLENIKRRDETVTVGAVIRRIDDSMGIANDIFTVIAGDGAPERWELETAIEGFDVYLNETADLEASEAVFEELTAGYSELNLYSRAEWTAAERQDKRMQQIVYAMITVLLSSVGLLGLVNTVSSRIYARKRELAMLRAVGMTRGQAIRMLTYEGALYGVLAAVISMALCFLVFTQMNVGYHPGGWAGLVAWPVFIGSLAACVLTGALTVFFPARAVMRGTIIENVRQAD